LIIAWWIASEQRHQVSFFKQIELQYSQNLLRAFLQLRLKLEKGQKQIYTQGNPYLRLNIGNGFGRELEVVGQEHITLSGFRIPITGAP